MLFLSLSLAVCASRVVAAAARRNVLPLTVTAEELSCSEFTANIAAHADNVDQIALNFTGTATVRVSGAWDIAFRFCQPLFKRPTLESLHANTVQILGSGATYTKEYWHFPYRPEMYSYQLHAAAAGYSTLAFDLLGAGASEKPDPFGVVQIALNTAIATSIVRRVRDGTLAGGTVPRLGQVVYVAHSMGSVVLNGILADSPELVDAAVLTGYSHPAPPVHIPTVANGDIQIAAETFPDKFGTLSPGYTVIQNRALFYGPNGTFEEAAFDTDVATQDLVSVGDADTLSYGERIAPHFTGPVFSVEGDLDAGNCTPNCTNIPDENVFYPSAASFEFHVVPQTAHVLNLHLTAPETFAVILEWITSKGF